MPVFKAIENGKGIGAFKNVLNYLVRADKDEEDKKVLISGIGVSNDPTKALKQMIYNKLVHNKLDKEALYKQFTQSYDSKDRDKLTPELVHKMGVLFAEENFEKYGFKCIVITHFEKDHIHNHFFVDNVNVESGLKYVILDDRAKNSKQYKKKIEQGKLKDHERMLDDLKKSSDDISFFYGIDRVEKGDKSINLYDKKLYKSVESGFLGKVIRNWNSILYDKTTNLSNFIEVLQSKGIYVKVDNYEVYFSRKEIKDPKQDNYVRLSYLKSVLDYQFKQSKTQNTFEYFKSMELLNKEKNKEKNIREVAVNNNRSNGKEKEKAEIEKEIQLSLKKEGLINLIGEYKKETDKVIESYYTPFRKELKQVIEDKFNDNTKVKKFMEEFNRDINTKSNFTPDEYKKELTYFILTELEKGEENLNKRISADYVRDTFKRGTSEFVHNSTPFFQLKTEDIMNSKIVRENSSTENSKRILKDKFLKELPTNYEIEKMSEKTLEKTINAVLKTFKNGIEEIKKYIEKSTEYELKERAKDIFIKNIGENKNNIDSIEEIKRDFVKIYNEYKDNSNIQLTNEVKKITKEYKELKEIEEKEKVLKKKDDYEYTYSSSSTSTTSTTTKTTTTVDREEKNSIEDAIRNQRIAEEQRLREIANAESNSNKKKVKSVIAEDKEKVRDREIE